MACSSLRLSPLQPGGSKRLFKRAASEPPLRNDEGEVKAMQTNINAI
jgi:hypothetical protein